MLRAISRRLIRAITSVYDPVINLQIGSKRIKAPLSHPLREIMEALPQFGFNITRLVEYADRYFGNLRVIDIGANIGDTVAFIRNYKNLPILCIDGDPSYFKLLRKNTEGLENVYSCQTMIGASNEIAPGELIRKNGSASVKESSSTTQFRTLENIFQDYPQFSTAKFLKIDTDGFDVRILKGSGDYIRRELPVLFFEYDPGLIAKLKDDPFEVFQLLKDLGYEYLVLYQNIGDYLLSVSLSTDHSKIFELVNYYMGRNSGLYADICAFPAKDQALFHTVREKELRFFEGLRQFNLKEFQWQLP